MHASPFVLKANAGGTIFSIEVIWNLELECEI
jgi:hypothetical protein